MAPTGPQSSTGSVAAQQAHVLCPHWSLGDNNSPLHLTEASTPDSSTKRPWSGSPSAKPGGLRPTPTRAPAGWLQFPHLPLDPTGLTKKVVSTAALRVLVPQPFTPGNLLVAVEASGTEPGLGTLPSGLCSVTRGHSTLATPTMRVYHGARTRPTEG